MTKALEISRKEFLRIKRAASFEEFKSDKSKEKDRLRKQSKAREATWGNTLGAQRLAKFKAREEREARLEAERVKLDELEAGKRRKERSGALSRANKLMYEQRDEIKSFRSKQMQSDVLAHNEAQLGERQLVIDEHNALEAYFHQVTMENMRKGNEADAAKKKAREEKAKWFAREQQQQLKESMQWKVDRLVQERIEGNIVVAKAIADIEAEKQKVAEARRRARQNNLEMKLENQKLEKLKDKEKLKLAKEMDKIQAYADERDHKIEQRKQHRKMLQAERQAAQQAMIDRAVELLSKMNTHEGARLEAQVADADAKNKAMLDARDEKRAQQAAAIHKSRQAMLARKARLKQEEKDNDKRIAKQWKAESTALQMKDQREKDEIKRRALELQAFVDNQRQEQAMRKIQSRKDSLAHDERVRKQRAKDEKQFRKTMRGELDKYREKGANLKAMMKCMEPRNELKGFVFY